MSKTICKVLALSLVSCILLSNLSVLNANTLGLAKKSTSNSNEAMTKESKVQVSEVKTPKATDSNVVLSKAETTKKVVVSETENVRRVVAQESEGTKEVVPEAKEPEVTIPEAKEPVEVEEPEITVPEAKEQEVTIPEVKEPVEEAPVEDTLEMEEKVEDILPTVEVEEPEITVPEAKEPEITIPEVKEPEVTIPEAKEPVEEAPVEDTPEMEEKVEATLPTVEVEEPEITVPEVKEPEVTIPEAKEPVEEAPVEDTPEMEEKVEATLPTVEVEEPEITVPEAKEPEVTIPEVKEPVEEAPAADTLEMREKVKVTLPTVEAEEPEIIEKAVQEDSKPRTTYEISGKSITVTWRGGCGYVSFAKFLYGDEKTSYTFIDSNGKAINANEWIGRRGCADSDKHNYACTLTLTAPDTKDGLVFDKWVKTTEDGKDIYTAVYKEENVKKSNEAVSTMLFQQPTTNVAQVSQLNEETKKSYTENTTSEEDRSVTVTYKGGCGMVTFAKFVFEGEGHNGSFIDADGNPIQANSWIGRRGCDDCEKHCCPACDITVFAPEAKDGWKFAGWVKTTDKDGFDTYTAKYILNQ